MLLKGGFCDGKRCFFWFSIYCGVVLFGVDKVFLIRFYVVFLRELFLLLVNIIIGKGF